MARVNTVLNGQKSDTVTQIQLRERIDFLISYSTLPEYKVKSLSVLFQPDQSWVLKQQWSKVSKLSICRCLENSDTVMGEKEKTLTCVILKISVNILLRFSCVQREKKLGCVCINLMQNT